MTESVRSYYDAFDEWARLDSPAGQLEFDETLSYVSDQLAPACTVLDIGGGPGRYTIALAQRGHDVWLLDPSAVQVQVAQERVAAAGVHARVQEASVGDVRDLSRFDPGSFDAALALGPFYHLVSESDRLRGAGELFRILRPGGSAYIAFIPRLSGVAALVSRAAADPGQVPPDTLSRVVSDGVFLNPTSRGFQDGYYPEVPSIQQLFESAGFSVSDLFSIRGLAYNYDTEFAELSANRPESAAAFQSIIDATRRDSSVIELCGHALLVVRKPSPDAA